MTRLVTGNALLCCPLLRSGACAVDCARPCALSRQPWRKPLFQKLHRRTLIQCIAAVAASTAFGCSDEETTPGQEGRDFFPQSVASGDPRPDSVVLWTRAVDPELAGQDTPVKLQVSTEESFSSLVLDKE